jgi:ABC-type sugar transport system permease subunit
MKHTKIGTSLSCYLWLLPALFLIFAFYGYSLLFAVKISTQSYSLMRVESPYVGGANYLRFLTSPEYWQALLVTCRFLLAAMVLVIAVSLCFALLLKHQELLKGLYRGLLMVPWMLSMLVTGLIFTWVFDSQAGVLNHILRQIGLQPVPWLSEPGPAFALLLIAYVWKVYPFAMVIFLAGLQSIDTEYYEAAAVDGAGPLRKFGAITLPFLRPQLLIVVVLLSISVFNMIDMVFAVTKGGPGASTMLISYFMYTNAFTHMEMGYSAAIAISLFLINAVLTLTYLRILKPEIAS